MNYPLDGVRKSYLKKKKTKVDFEYNDMIEAGYTPEEIKAIRGTNG